MSVNIHFLNVGDGDCTIVQFPKRESAMANGVKENYNARIMMIDTFHHENHDEYEDAITYYKRNFGREPIFRLVLTHPHKDHIKGIKRVFEEEGISIVNLWDLEHDFEPDQTTNHWENYKEDWEFYSKIRNDEEKLKILRYFDHSEKYPFWDEDRIEILSPSKELFKRAHYKEDGAKKEPKDVDLNNMPYVLLISVNSLKILLASDAEEACWKYIVENHGDKIKDIDIFKASHHGRKSGFYEAAVKLMRPKNIIFSISEDCDGVFGAEKEYLQASPNSKVHKTKDHGNMLFKCHFDGRIEAQKN